MFIKYIAPLAVGLSLSGQSFALTLQESLIAANHYNAEINAARRIHDAESQKKTRDSQACYRKLHLMVPGVKPTSRMLLILPVSPVITIV